MYLFSGKQQQQQQTPQTVAFQTSLEDLLYFGEVFLHYVFEYILFHLYYSLFLRKTII